MSSSFVSEVALVLHCLAESISLIADGMDRENGTAAEAPAAGTLAAEATGPAAKPVSIEDIRAVLAEKSADGRTAEVRALLYRYDAGKLSGVKPEDYPALFEEAKKL